MELFIKNVMSDKIFEGCWYHQLDEKYYLVFAYNNNDELCGKIAYNCDDLQCDYDWDWYMPEQDGEVIDTEIYNCKLYTLEELVSEFENIYEQVKNI